jgi:uncharacterized protein YkwD
VNKLADPTFQQSADFVKGMLAVHNSERATVGSPPLVWNNTLAAQAKAWAEHLSPAGVLYHDPNIPYHEGESAANSLSNGPNLWINEKLDYHSNGQPLSNDDITRAGHYLQMVWRAATSVGCGTAANPHEILVCRYSPSAIGEGQKPY